VFRVEGIGAFERRVPLTPGFSEVAYASVTQEPF